MAENGDTTAPLTEQGKKSGSKKTRGGVNCRVLLLDGSEYEVQVSKSAVGQELVDKVCDFLQLAEKDYFSCSIRDSRNTRFWVTPERPLGKAGKRARPNWLFYFEMKFYPLEPSVLREDYTRYLMFLQVRVDMVSSRLPCSFLTQALLGSYAVQSDLGDFNPTEHGNGCEYLKDIKFAPKQSEELLSKIAELHATHRGEVPNEAELNYLENAKLLALFGVHMHPAKETKESGEEGADVNIGVGAAGIVVYKDQIRVHRFPWAKILKIAYKRNTFTIKIRPGEIEEEQQTLVYKLPSNILAKRLWRIAVEHHGFFRLKEPDGSQRAHFPHFGSKFRYSGRTQHQARGATDDIERPIPKINRKASTRFIGAKEANFNTGTGTGGYSTDRAEQYTVDEPRTATLDLKNRSNRTGGGTGGSVPMAGPEDDPSVNYGHDDDGHVALLSGTQVNYSKPGYQQGGPMYGGQDTSVDDYPGGDSTTGRYQPGSMDRRDAGGRGPDSTFGSRFSEDGEDSMRRYQEDQRLVHGQGPAGQGMWSGGGAYSSTTTTKTSKRTFTDVDGTVITEYITEKDGVIEKRIEKRTVETNADDDFDHDQALMAAIKSVTDMNPDLSVEKIEIQTKSES